MMMARGLPQFAVLALVLIACQLVSPSFFALSVEHGRLFGSLIDVLVRGTPVALLTLGMTLVIATGGIDLSVGAVMAIAGATVAACVNAAYPAPVAILAALGTGIACGLWNGLLVAVFAIQPIVATLILMVAGRGIAQLITEGQIVTFTDPTVSAIAGGSVGFLPMPVMIAAAAFLLVLLLVRGTALGLFIEAIGVNRRASEIAGIDARAVVLAVYTLSGLMAAVAGVIAAADIRGADANNAGLWLELDAILSVVVGGTSLLGGRFSLPLAIVGAVIIQTMNTGILLSGFTPEFNLIVKSVVVFIVLVLQSPALADRVRRLTAARSAQR
jgi:simple sugar transport system permease protein